MVITFQFALFLAKIKNKMWTELKSSEMSALQMTLEPVSKIWLIN